VLVPPTRVGLPNRDTESNASPRNAFTLRVWCMRKTRTGRRTERRTRLPYASDDYSCVRGCMRLGRMRDDVPLLGALRTSAVIGAPPATGGIPATVDGPTEAVLPTTPREGRRLSPDQDAFHRHDTRRSHAEGGIPPAFAPALSLTPPTRSPEGWRAWMGIARSRCGHPLAVNTRVRTPF
jgi:hypothetical protein